jgi:type II secretory pathway pseudopilin PulG
MKHSQKRNGLALIEVFVVIGIIATLAALLLPVLAKAKAQAKAICGLSNLTQLQKAWFLSVQDNNDALPPDLLQGVPGGMQ